MGEAWWLLRVVPEWFFETVSNPFVYGWLTAIPAAGALSLILGVGLAIWQRKPRLWLFLLPFLASEALLVLAGLQSRQIPSPDWIIYSFLGGQLLLAIGLIVYVKGARLAATALALFSLSYALFAGFVATMSFTGDWL